MKQPQTLKFKKLHPKAKLPTRGTDGAAGYDLHLVGEVFIESGDTKLLDLGVAVEIPKGYCGLLVPRSSLHKHGMSQANGVGVIDHDYRGELKVPITNNNLQDIVTTEGNRIAQLVIVPCFMAEPEWTDELSETERGGGGFGSTGS